MEPLLTGLTELPHTNEILLIPELLRWYKSDLALPGYQDNQPGIYSNFVTTSDGRTSYNEPSHLGGGDISQGNVNDRRIMALLRATTDAVLVGANTLRLEPNHIWIPEFILPEDTEFIDMLNKQRVSMGKDSNKYLHLFVTASGNINSDAAIFKAKNVEICFITTYSGAKRISQSMAVSSHKISYLKYDDGDTIDMAEALKDVRLKYDVNNILCEGGPKLIGSLLSSQTLSKVFMSISNTIIGNGPDSGEPDRPSWVSGYYGHPDKVIRLIRETVKFDPKMMMEFQSSRVVYPD